MAVVVFLADGFEEVEALTPVDYLRRVGVSVVTASCGASLQVCGSHGITVLADSLASAVAEGKVGAVDAVVVPGGMPGASNVAECRDALSIVDSVRKDGGFVAAICAAPVVVLARTGLLAGKKYTCYPGMERQLEKWCGPDWEALSVGSDYTGGRCVRDGKLLTAAGPGAAEEFAVELVRLLAGDSAAESLKAGSLLR